MSFNFERNLLDEISDAIVAKTQAGRILYWNRGAATVFGYSRDEAVGRLVSELIIPEDRLEEESRILQDVLLSELSQYETMRRRKDGSLIYVDVSSRAVCDPEGKVNFILSSNKDVTRLKVERDARLAEARYAKLLESTPDGIIMANPAGRIVLANTQAEKLFGYAHGELRGQLTEVLLPPRFRNATGEKSPLLFLPSTGKGVSVRPELIGQHKDGTEFPIEISRSPLELEDGLLMISAIRDASERKRFEQALHEKNVELLASAESKNRFLANMSHELRTPLNGIIGFAEFLTDGKPGPLNPKQKEYLADILNSGRHLLQLINDVLDLAKVEANRMELTPEPFSLAKAIEGVCAVARALAQKKDLRFTVEIATGLDEVFLDQQKFKQILYNLVSNAVKFTDEGGQVEVRAAPRDDDRFRLEVQDTGIGIRNEDLPRLFKEFEQLESGAGRRYEGTGLGLALTRRIVELQGGSIAVDSEPGKGSIFTVVLPRRLGKETP